MDTWKLGKNILAKLIINNDRMPLDNDDKRHVVTWLRQMADEMERGEHFSSTILQLQIRKEK